MSFSIVRVACVAGRLVRWYFYNEGQPLAWPMSPLLHLLPGYHLASLNPSSPLACEMIFLQWGAVACPAHVLGRPPSLPFTPQLPPQLSSSLHLLFIKINLRQLLPLLPCISATHILFLFSSSLYLPSTHLPPLVSQPIWRTLPRSLTMRH